MKITPLKLDGATLRLGPLLAATIRDHKEAIGQARSGQIQPPEMIELTVRLVHACARRVDPSITLDQVEDLIDMDNFSTAFAACWGASVPESEPGEAPAAVRASPST